MIERLESRTLPRCPVAATSPHSPDPYLACHAAELSDPRHCPGQRQENRNAERPSHSAIKSGPPAPDSFSQAREGSFWIAPQVKFAIFAKRLKKGQK